MKSDLQRGKTNFEFTLMYGTRNFHRLLSRDLNEAVRIIDYILEHTPIQTIVTAPHYDNGMTEKFIGDNYSHRRRHYKIATSVGITYTEKGLKLSLDASKIENQLYDIKGRLKTDYIDLLQLHHDDYFCDLGKTSSYLESIMQSGEIGALGVTNFTLPRLKEWTNHIHIDYIQLPVNLFQIQSIEDIVNFCQDADIQILAHSIYGNGMLISPDINKAELFPYLEDGVKKELKVLLSRFQKEILPGFSNMAEIVIPWISELGYVEHIIFGSQDISHITYNVKALSAKLKKTETDQLNSWIDSIKKSLPNGLLITLEVEKIFKKDDLRYIKMHGAPIVIPETITEGDVIYMNEGNGEILSSM